MILNQIPQHISALEQMQTKIMCYFFDDNNCAVKLLLEMIKDFLKEYESNQDMIHMLEHYDEDYYALIEMEFNHDVTEHVTDAYSYCRNMDANVKEVYSWFGYNPDYEECKMMDPIFRLFFIFISHLQSRIRVNKDGCLLNNTQMINS